MIPVEQSILSPPLGDCFRACVASVLELPLEDVPNPHGDEWWGEWQRWLAGRGLFVMNFPLGATDPWRPPGYWIAAVDEGRMVHAVVMHGPDLVWNPHPFRDRGVGEPQEVTIIAALDPSQIPALAGAR